MQANMRPPILERRQCRSGAGVTVTNLDCRFDFLVVAGIIDPGRRVPVDSIDFEFVTD